MDVLGSIMFKDRMKSDRFAHAFAPVSCRHCEELKSVSALVHSGHAVEPLCVQCPG